MYLRELRSILLLASPLIIGQLSQMLIGVVDTVMVGQIGVLPLAALTFANTLFYIPFVFGIGILTCISVRTSTARGQQQPEQARNVCRNGIYLSFVLGLVCFILSLLFYPFIGNLGQPADVVEHSRTFYLIIMVSLIPCLMSLMLKNHADALDRPWPAFTIFLGGVGLNVLLNQLLIFGAFGIPAMGLVGAGIATLISRIAIVIAMLVWFKNATSLKDFVPHHWFRKPDLTECLAQLKLGIPAGLQTLAEVSAFSIAGLLIGHFGAEALASHQIALTSSGMAFMIPLGLSMALTVRMGESSHQPERRKRIALTGWFLTLIVSCSTAALFIFGGTMVARWYIDHPGIIHLTTSLLFVSGIFQIVDGLQVSTTGMLRGLHDTRHPALIGILSYWIIGIPIGYFLAHYTALGPQGVWWGLAAGLGTAALLLIYRLTHMIWKS